MKTMRRDQQMASGQTPTRRVGVIDPWQRPAAALRKRGSRLGWAGVVALHPPQSAWSGGQILTAGETSLCGVELARTHTSVLIEELVAQAPDGPVDLDWLLGHLDKRSFGLLLLLLGLLVIVPGVASIATLMVIFPSVEMMLGRSRPSFPRFLSKRPFDFKRFKRLTEIVQPGLRAIENLSRPRWTLPHAAAHRLVGAVVFLLALSAIWPLPLVNVIPGAVIILIAIAYLQEDGLLLAVASAAALLSLTGFGWTVWTSGGALMRWMGHPS